MALLFFWKNSFEITGTGSLVLKGQELYGSSRLGTYQRNVEVENLGEQLMMGDGSYIWDNRFFELSNHLGNVLATTQDRMTVIHSSGVGYYDPVVVSAQDYYAGGMQMPGRTYNAGNYAYGFNGKRKDNEIHGEENAYDFGSRIYDPRVVTWYSPDSKASKHPYESPYMKFVSGKQYQAMQKAMKTIEKEKQRYFSNIFAYHYS